MDDWQPIETAPRDGTQIIVYRPYFDGNYIPQVGPDFWMRRGGPGCWGRSRADTQPTMWQPMPAPPHHSAHTTKAAAISQHQTMQRGDSESMGKEPGHPPRGGGEGGWPGQGSSMKDGNG